MLGVGFKKDFFIWARCAEPEELNEVLELSAEVRVLFFCTVGKPLASVEDKVIIEKSKGLEG